MTCALMEPQPVILDSQNAMSAVDCATIERRIRINRPDEGRGRCKVSRAWDPRKDFSRCKQQHKIPSTSNAISPQQERTEPSGHRPCRHGQLWHFVGAVDLVACTVGLVVAECISAAALAVVACVSVAAASLAAGSAEGWLPAGARSSPERDALLAHPLQASVSASTDNNFAFRNRFFIRHHHFRNFAFFGAPFAVGYDYGYGGCWQQLWTGYGWQWVNLCNGYGYGYGY